MVEAEERSVDDECLARTRAVMLQKRFQELISIIIKDTQDTFRSLMEDIDKGKEPVKKLPSVLQQTTDRLDHCHDQMAGDRKSWNPPKAGEGGGNAGMRNGSCGDFDAPSIISSLQIRGSCHGAFDAPSLSPSNLDRDEIEASERLKRLIEEELCSRRKMNNVKARNSMLLSKRTDSNSRSLAEEYSSDSQRRSKTTDFSCKNLEAEYPTSSQRLDSLIEDELNRMKISKDIAKDESNRIDIDANVPIKYNDNPRQSLFRRYSPINSSRRPKIWADILRTKCSIQSESTRICDSNEGLQLENMDSEVES